MENDVVVVVVVSFCVFVVVVVLVNSVVVFRGDINPSSISLTQMTQNIHACTAYIRKGKKMVFVHPVPHVRHNHDNYDNFSC